MRCCPHCGALLPSSDLAGVLSPTELRVYEAIRVCGTAGATREDVLRRAWADDPDGGPATFNIVSVHVKHIRQKLEPLGITIDSVGGPGSRYYVRPCS